MKTIMQTILKNSAGVSVNVTGMTAYAASKLDGVQGNIGKTSISCLLDGSKASVNGWSVTQQAEEPPQGFNRANKAGVEYCGTGKLRQRNPMKITCKLTQAGETYRVKASKDFARFLNVVATSPNSEYNNIAESLGWSRDYVAVYAARAKSKGLIETTKQSGAIFGMRG